MVASAVDEAERRVSRRRGDDNECEQARSSVAGQQAAAAAAAAVCYEKVCTDFNSTTKRTVHPFFAFPTLSISLSFATELG